MGTITQETPAPLAHPNLPLPLMCGGAAEDANDFTCGNLVDSLEQQRNPLAVTDDTSRFSDAVVAQQCLQLMLVRDLHLWRICVGSFVQPTMPSKCVPQAVPVDAVARHAALRR